METALENGHEVDRGDLLLLQQLAQSLPHQRSRQVVPRVFQQQVEETRPARRRAKRGVQRGEEEANAGHTPRGDAGMRRNGLQKGEKGEGLLAKLRLADDNGGEVDDFDDETLQNVLEVHLDGGAAHALEEGDDESPDESDSVGVLAEKQHEPVELGLVHGNEAAGRLMAGGDAKRVVRGEKGLEENHPAVDVDAVASREELLHAAFLNHVGHAGLEVRGESFLSLSAEERAQRGPEAALLAAMRLQRGVTGRERRVVGGSDVEERRRGREKAARVQPEEEIDDFLPFLG